MVWVRGEPAYESSLCDDIRAPPGRRSDPSPPVPVVLNETGRRADLFRVVTAAPRVAHRRVQSLDVFRGVTVAAMLVVNNPGSWTNAYSSLHHASWNGWTPTDLIFPAFLFIAGVAMHLALTRRLGAGVAPGTLLAGATRRAIALFFIGLALNAFPWWHSDLSALRIPGVLQRIAATTLLAAPAVLWMRTRGRALTVVVLLLGYWYLMSRIPPGGAAPGVLEPGQDLAAYVDRMVFGVSHLSAATRQWDALGLLGTIPATASVLLGVLAGEWLTSERSAEVITGGLLASGVVALVVGQSWSLVFPINKNLWTSSYTVFAAGWAALGLASCYWIVDVRRMDRWARPFVWLGVNALVVYVLSELGNAVFDMLGLRQAAYRALTHAWMSPAQASLAYALWLTLGWASVTWAGGRIARVRP
jgi:predicted acyltransferase